MEIKVGKQTKSCGSICFDKNSKGHFFVVAEFMLGDADDYKNVFQTSFKKLDKKSMNLLLALEVLPHNLENVEIMSEYIEIPYSEYSYWSYQGFSILYVDKNMDLFDCSIEYNQEEQAYIDSMNWE